MKVESKIDLTPVLKEYYTQEVHLNYEAMGFNLKDIVEYKQEGIKGHVIYFEILESMTARKVGTAGTFSKNSKGGAISRVGLMTEEYIAEFFYRELDFDKDGLYLHPKYAERVIEAIGVQSDITISTLFHDDNNFVDRNTGSIRIVGDESTPLSFDTFLKGKALINRYAVNTKGRTPIWCLVDYVAEYELSKFEELRHSDFVYKAFHDALTKEGTVDGMRFWGMNFKLVENLGDHIYGGYKHIKAGEIIFAMQDALGFGTNSQPKAWTEFIPDREGSFQTACIGNFGAIVINSNGLAKVKYLPSDETIMEIMGLSSVAEFKEYRALTDSASIPTGYKQTVDGQLEVSTKGRVATQPVSDDFYLKKAQEDEAEKEALRLRIEELEGKAEAVEEVILEEEEMILEEVVPEKKKGGKK